MDYENKNKKKESGLGKFFHRLWKYMAASRETSHLRQEQRRIRAEIELAGCEAEAQRRAAGQAAFELWRDGGWGRAEQELTEYFTKMREREEEILKKNSEIEKLEEQIRAAGHRHAEEAGKPGETAGNETAAADRGLKAACICPACGASFHRPANFCRRCGALMAQAPQPLEASGPNEAINMKNTEGEL